MSRFNIKNLFLTFFLSFFLLNYNAFALKIIGNERVDEKTILSYLDVKGIDSNSKSAIKKSIKKLYSSELFLEARIYFKKGKAILKVKENPIVLEVKIVGNNKIDDDALEAELSLKRREIYTKAKLENDLKRLNELYLKSGRFLTKIEPKLIEKSKNRVEVIFDVFEGKKAKIADIYFVGNVAYPDRSLAEAITTKKSQWWKFLSSADTYDSDRIEFDKEKLRRFYGNRGFADFNAISSIAQISKKKDNFHITFLLEEGIKYKMGEVKIINHIKKFDESILEDDILIKSGKYYNLEKIEKTVDKMVEKMSEKSYAFAHIQPVVKRKKSQKIIDLDFVIKETPRVYINQINITGNTRTLDSVIRRELRFRQGDPYNITRINRSKQRLQNLGYFENVTLDTKRIGQGDKVNVEIIVKEKKTGELNLGIGYSTVDKITMNAGIRERNLFGTGQQLGFNIQKSFRRLSSSVNYTKPYFMDYPLDVGFDIFQYEIDKRNTLVYDQSSQGFTLRAGYNMTEYLTHSLRYNFRDESISNVDSDASVGIRNLEGDFLVSGVGQSFLYDRRDNKINPKRGYYISISQDYNGVGGDINTLKHEGTAGYYIPVFNEDFIFKFLARGGYIDGLGEDVRSNFGFFLGGNSFRGFEFAGIGPRTAGTNGNADGGDIIGGNMYYVGSAEFMFPLGLPKELGINGVLFSDNGTVKGVDLISRENTRVVDTGSLRSSYGFSLVWASPMGPIRLDFAKAAKKEDFDRTENFRFSFGTTF